MTTRIALRRNGEKSGVHAALPSSLADLLNLATVKLKLPSPASRVFSAAGDEFDDIKLIEKDDVLHITCGEDLAPHLEACAASCAAAAAPTAVPEAAPPATAITLGVTNLQGSRPKVPLLRRVELEQVDYLQLTSFDVSQQSFEGEIFVSFLFRGGAHDEFLSAGGTEFPLDDNGKPTFLPSAKWFLDQLTTANGISCTIHDKKTIKAGDDLRIQARFQGKWYDEVDSRDFPFDRQDFAIKFRFDCRTTGMVPLEVVAPDSATGIISDEGFQIRDCWRLLSPAYRFSACVSGTGARAFPAVEVMLSVQRKPFSAILQVLLPSWMWTALCLMTYFLEPVKSKVYARFSTALTMMLLGYFHRAAMDKYLPPSQMLSLADLYLYINFVFMVAICLQAPMNAYFGTLENVSEREDIDLYFCLSFLACWTLVHAWFARRIWRLRGLPYSPTRLQKIRRELARDRAQLEEECRKCTRAKLGRLSKRCARNQGTKVHRLPNN